ncbi:PKD domain-containing protein [Saccharothrix sp. BKS2]|uniref:PKD domain-containing protein n=1 Tax=Saccharothrix sp. BKS2 TaxID=3064400 RepID=UPI0039EC4058
MLSSRRRASARARVAAIGSATAVLTALLPGVAHAEPPSNDDFDRSTPVTALPFSAQQDTSEATGVNDDPSWCQFYNVEGGVWFTHTATADGFLRADTAGSDHPTVLSANTGDRRDLRGVDDACDIGTDATVTFRATAGTTYHFFVAGYDVTGGALRFNLAAVAPAPNDAFAAAEPVTALPHVARPDLSTATFEADEPESSCVDAETVPSVWYSYTPVVTTSVTARVEHTDTAVTVYTGAAPHELTQVACKAFSYGEPTAFRATAGTTYHLRVTGPVHSHQPVALHLDEAPALRPYVDRSTSDPSVYDTVHFSPGSWSSIDRPLSGEWDFGDGTTAPSTTGSVSHRYPADGTYRVTLRAASPDGRTATVTSDVVVATHDVAISRFDVPRTAGQGETKTIEVHVANTRYDEVVTVVLHRHDGRSWSEVGSQTLVVPARPTRKVRFPFAYTFTPDDAVLGKVGFRAEVRLPYPARDARPVDNEVISIATTVTGPAGLAVA